MRATIVVDDNIVLVDGKPQTVDCSPLIADGIHAVQWYDTFGEVEFRNEVDVVKATMTRQPNQTITDFAPYQSYVDQWEIENAKPPPEPPPMPMPQYNITHDHENRLRALEGKPPLTMEDFFAKMNG